MIIFILRFKLSTSFRMLTSKVRTAIHIFVSDALLDVVNVRVSVIKLHVFVIVMFSKLTLLEL